MLRELVEKEANAVRNAAHTMRDWLHTHTVRVHATPQPPREVRPTPEDELHRAESDREEPPPPHL
jgi:hypothetical protein